MKKFLLGLLLLFLSLLAYAYHIVSSSGYFRAIDNRFEGSTLASIALPGVEDIQVDPMGGFALLSSDDRAARRDGKPRRGHLYYLNLQDSTLTPRVLTEQLKVPFYPHGISMIPLDSGRYKIYAINHVGGQHSIEVFELRGDTLHFLRSLRHELMVSPNDIVAIDAERFYFTNDHGYTRGIKRLGEEYLGWAVSNVIYFDGTDYREVADGIAYANGINMDAERQLLFVASPRDFLVKVYRQQPSGELLFAEDIPCGTGVDNIELGPEGRLWVGCHPSLLHFTAYAAGKNEVSPSEIITIDYREAGDYEVNSIFMNDGHLMTSSTVAAPYRDLILVGNVMDDHFLVLQRSPH